MPAPHLSKCDHEIVELVERAQVECHEPLVEVLVHLRLVRVLVEVLEGRLALEGDPPQSRTHTCNVGVLRSIGWR